MLSIEIVTEISWCTILCNKRYIIHNDLGISTVLDIAKENHNFTKDWHTTQIHLKRLLNVLGIPTAFVEDYTEAVA